MGLDKYIGDAPAVLYQYRPSQLSYLYTDARVARKFLTFEWRLKEKIYPIIVLRFEGKSSVEDDISNLTCRINSVDFSTRFRKKLLWILTC